MNSKYRFIEKCGAGAFADVIKAEQISTGKTVAIKRLKQRYKNVQEVTCIREVQALKAAQSCNLVCRIIEILFDQRTGKLAFVFEFYDCCLYDLIRHRQERFQPNQLKWYCFQICASVFELQTKKLMHRDIKPENFLVKKLNVSSWTGDIIRLSDLGSCRFLDQLDRKQALTEYISTRWYRAPEIILSDGYYGPEVDFFATGCLLFEIATMKPLFPGKDETSQMELIHSLLGTPSPEVLIRLRGKSTTNPLLKTKFPPKPVGSLADSLPHIDFKLVDLVQKLICYDPKLRMTADAMMSHEYFSDMKDVFAVVRSRTPEADPYLQFLEEVHDDFFKAQHVVEPIISLPSLPALPSKGRSSRRK